MIRLGDIAKVTAGQAAPKEFGDKGFPFIRAGHLQELLTGNLLESLPKVSNEVAKKKRLKLIPKGTILFAKSGMSATKNRIYITAEDSYFVSHLAGILPSKGLSNSFLARFLSWYNPSKLILDSAYPSIRLEDINNLKIPLPPLDQQKKIAAILDAADTYRQKTKALITKYDELTQSLFLDMFGDPVTNPKGWDKGDLEKNLIKVDKIDKSYEEVEIEYVDIASIDQSRNTITGTTNYKIEERPSRAQQILKSGDILFSTVRPNLKNIAINDVDGRIASTGFFVNRTDATKLSNHFLFNLLLTNSVTEYFVSITSGANYPAVKSSEMKKFQIILPSLEIQNQFAERVKVIEAQKTQAQESLEQANNLFNSLLQKAFKGELV